jgi:hypothetical protein
VTMAVASYAATAHHTGASSAAGAGASPSPTSASLPRVVPTTKVVAIPLVENAHTMRTRCKMVSASFPVLG